MPNISEKEIFVNPYVIQMDKLADSLGHLSSTFLKLTDYKRTFTKEENEDMFQRRCVMIVRTGRSAWERGVFKLIR